MFQLLSLTVAAIVVLTYRLWINRKLRKRHEAFILEHGCQPPARLSNHRPWGLDRVEQIFRADAESRLLELFLFHFRFSGNTVEYHILGTQTFGTIEPRNLEVMLGSKFDDWSLGLRDKIMEPMFGSGIFTQTGPSWKTSREMLRPQFTHRQYEDCEMFRHSTDVFLNIVGAQKGPVDLQPSCLALTLDVTTAFLFGSSVGSLTSTAGEEAAEFAVAFNTGQGYLARRARLHEFYWLLDGRKFRSTCAAVHSFADRIIDQNLSAARSEESKGRYVFLDSLAAACPDRRTLREQIINVLVAGRDTTAYLISWTIFLLVRHPTVLEKLRAEVEVAFGDGDHLTRTQLKDMTYLQNVLKEVLRLYPPVPINSRAAVRDTWVPVGGGPDGQSPLFIPQGAELTYSAYAMHRRADFFGLDAELFRPERWQESMPINKDPIDAKWGYLPFNGGPRVCLGMDFGLTEAGYVVAKLLQRFSVVELPPDEKVELVGVEKQTVTLVLSITRGCRVRLESRT